MNNDIRTQAIAQNEVVLSYIAAGFTRAEAIDILKAVVVAQLQAGGQSK